MKKMRLLLVLVLCNMLAPVNAQNTLRTNQQYTLGHSFTVDQVKDSTPAKKWTVSSYMGISSSISFFKGGNATLLSVPIGIQLNRQLSNNWYAFAGIALAPGYINFNGTAPAMYTSKFPLYSNGFNSARLNMQARAEMGLMYTNDQKTFSISGSIGVERNSYPMVSPALGARPVNIPY